MVGWTLVAEGIIMTDGYILGDFPSQTDVAMAIIVAMLTSLERKGIINRGM